MDNLDVLIKAEAATAFHYGDINADGKVNASDALLIL